VQLLYCLCGHSPQHHFFYAALHAQAIPSIILHLLLFYGMTALSLVLLLSSFCFLSSRTLGAQYHWMMICRLAELLNEAQLSKPGGPGAVDSFEPTAAFLVGAQVLPCPFCPAVAWLALPLPQPW
jgi:hypothetical protein